METRRETLVRLLEGGAMTPHQLAEETLARMKDVLEDLEHVRRTLGPRMKVEPATCAQCGFVFRGRRKLSTPSRCPKCKSERVEGPWISARA